MGEMKESEGKSGESLRKIVPIFILLVLKNCTDREHPMTQKDMKRHLMEDYSYEIGRQALGHYVNLMLDEELHIFGSASSGYFYDEDGYLCIE